MLLGWARRAKTAQALAMRARIVLACADGLSNSEASRQLGVSLPTVGKWRKRFTTQRLAGLSDEPRPGAPRKITDAQVEAVIVATLETTPSNQDSHWSTRSMARSTGLNQTAVSRIWRAFGLKPHLVDTWKLSTDPLFIDKVGDVVGSSLCAQARLPVTAGCPLGRPAVAVGITACRGWSSSSRSRPADLSRSSGRGPWRRCSSRL